MKIFLCVVLCLSSALSLAGCRSGQPAANGAPSPTLSVAFGAPRPSTTPGVTTATQEASMPSPTPAAQDAFAMNARISRSVNLGNALEADHEGDWGVTLQAGYFQRIHAKGFQAVRVPIRWPAHAGQSAPYTIDPSFFARIDWVVDQANSNDLAVILDMHNYYEMMSDPAGQRERFLSLWEQIARHYQAAPPTVLFELLNEPNGDKMTAATWNDLAGAALAEIRATNPRRVVVIGPVGWNSLDQLDTLALPESDPNIIATFHFYDPFNFTHQGAEWVDGSDAWLGTQWKGTDAEKAAITRSLDRAAQWAQQNHRPLLLGEFGAYSKADMDSRARWTAFIARQAEARGFSWGYWEFCAGFGVYDPASGAFRRPLLEALIPPG